MWRKTVDCEVAEPCRGVICGGEIDKRDSMRGPRNDSFNLNAATRNGRLSDKPNTFFSATACNIINTDVQKIPSGFERAAARQHHPDCVL
jgi:hypothetical protein